MADTKTPEPKQQVNVDAKELIKELLPMLAALEGMRPKPEAERPRVQAPAIRQICHVCRQALAGCEGKHVQLVVYPQRYPEHGQFFQGVFLNGVKYLSNDDGHEITVPANAANSIRQLVQNFENNEQETRIGRKAERYSGSLGPGGSAVNPQHIGWR